MIKFKRRTIFIENEDTIWRLLTKSGVKEIIREDETIHCYGGISIGILKDKVVIVRRGLDKISESSVYEFTLGYHDLRKNRPFPSIFFLSKEKAKEFIRNHEIYSRGAFDTLKHIDEVAVEFKKHKKYWIIL